MLQIIDDPPELSKRNSKNTINDHSSSKFKSVFLKFTIIPAIILTIVGIYSIEPLTWMITGIDHVYFEVISVVLAFIAASYCLTRGYVLKDKFSLFIGLGFHAAGAIDLLHGAFSFWNLGDSSFESYFIPQTWVAGRILMSVVFLIALAKFSNFDFQHFSGSLKKSFTSFSVGLVALAGAITAFSLHSPLPFVTIDFVIQRPYEIVSATILIFGIYYFYKNGLHHKKDAFYKGVLLALVIDVFVNIIISYSSIVFDTAFAVSHVLKNVSYFVFTITLATSLAQNFKQKQDTAVKLEASENVLRRNLKEMKKIEQAKEEFSAMISHELKTPITPITMWADALREPDMLGKLNAEQTNAVNKISDSAEQLKQLVGDMFDAYKLDLNKVAFVSESFLVNKLIHDIIGNYDTISQEKNISITHLPISSIEMQSDERRIKQVLKNLINNAVDFVEKDKGLITVNAIAENQHVIFSVKDNGVGISEENQKSLFRKFYQIDTSYTREHGGSGLGLTISKGIVEGLGGKIWVESKLGEGTSFYFSIPKKR